MQNENELYTLSNGCEIVFPDRSNEYKVSDKEMILILKFLAFIRAHPEELSDR